METLTRKEQALAAIQAARRAGQRIALVPTMGYLHAGHLALLREGRRRGDLLVATLFVNPLQFGPQEDLARYPRDLARDQELCASCGVDLLYAPEVAEVYPPGFSTSVTVGGVSEPLCGLRRPGHFTGVATVVLKLFNLLQPHVALFGEKDYQQLVTLRRMVRDLDLDLEVVGVPIVRDPDGLALSSRNVFLTPAQRASALTLPRALVRVEEAFVAGERDARRLEGLALALLAAEPGLRVDYLEVRDAGALGAVTLLERPAVVAGAVFVGSTRLIDNRQLA